MGLRLWFGHNNDELNKHFPCLTHNQGQFALKSKSSNFFMQFSFLFSWTGRPVPGAGGQLTWSRDWSRGGSCDLFHMTRPCDPVCLAGCRVSCVVCLLVTRGGNKNCPVHDTTDPGLCCEYSWLYTLIHNIVGPERR